MEPPEPPLAKGLQTLFPFYHTGNKAWPPSTTGVDESVAGSMEDYAIHFCVGTQQQWENIVNAFMHYSCERES